MSGNAASLTANFIARPAVKRTQEESRNLRMALAGSIAGIEKRRLVLEDIPSSEPARKNPPAERQKADTAHFPASSPVLARPLHIPFGIDAIDDALDPQNRRGILANGLHEVRVSAGLDAASGAGFALCLGIALAKGIRALDPKKRMTDGESSAQMAPVFWISDDFTRLEYGRFYGPGLAIFGLAPRDLVRIHPKTREETLWAAGEIAAAKGAASLCLIEINGHPKQMDLTATRRLMLRARAANTPVILLRQSGHEEASAAATRWHVLPAVSRLLLKQTPKETAPLMHQFIGPPAFCVQLEKCRGGNADETTRWNLEWTPDEQRFTLIETGPDTASQGNHAHRSTLPEDRKIPAISPSLSGNLSASITHRQDHAPATRSLLAGGNASAKQTG